MQSTTSKTFPARISTKPCRMASQAPVPSEAPYAQGTPLRTLGQMFDDEARGKIHVGLRRDGLRPCIIDTGPDMEPSQLSRLRHAYEKGGRSDGHGLGMAIAFGLAREHGLTLAVTSIPGRGTCFTLHLA